MEHGFLSLELGMEVSAVLVSHMMEAFFMAFGQTGVDGRNWV
jgi:hypothetical protein